MENGIADKSLRFAIRTVKLYQYLSEQKKEFVLSKQFLRSGTAIGALVREAEHAQSKADFLNKMNIALKEANETLYWVILLRETAYLSEDEFQSIHNDAEELVKILVSIVKTTKQKLNRI
ncbi:four helix bundle protein [Parapedobacter sp. SGR-10]|uniref:four helix bundle protein n=1 Tax=Parapedobacter sp. SGR-10 TaxID=2710879 RepID=UPI0013D62A3D|nr:four helix bundle protein [Parapedobacter sp. SGR-10]NGF57791.1 four helix bundle protein [Parapedobacter sp. SGR-10]